MQNFTKPKVIIFGAGRMGMIRYNLMKDGQVLNLLGFYTNDAQEKQKLKSSNFPVIENLEEGFKQTDGIWICTPTSTHKDLIMKLAPLGKPIACEKPISDNTESIKEVYDFCAKYKCQLIPCFQRRHDDKCKKFFEQLSPDWKHIKMMARDNPIPDPATLANMGSIFIDLFCHDINQILWYTNGELPVSVQASGFNTIPSSTALDYAVATFQYKIGKIVTFEISRFSPDNYDQRVEAMSEKQKLKLEYPDYNIPYSFPERYNDAFFEEIKYFSNIIQGKPVQIVNQKEHCILTSFLCEKLKESHMLEKKIYLNRKEKIIFRQIGYGPFGQLMDQIVFQKILDKIEVQEPFRVSNKNMKIEDVFQDKLTDVVYVCSPDHTHFDYAKACLINRKHVLCEKPICSNFRNLANIAESTEKILMIGFQRRFDDRFLAAKEFIVINRLNIKTVTIKSFDACEASQNTNNVEEGNFVIANSNCHDLDCISLCFPQDIIEITDCYPQPKAGIIIQGQVKSKAQEILCQFQINFDKGNKFYTQKVIIKSKDNQTVEFGEDYDPAKGQFNQMCEYYSKAYVKQFDYFLSMVNKQKYDATLLNSYKRTFDLMAETQHIFAQKLSQKNIQK